MQDDKKSRGSKGVTPNYLSWKRAGSKGGVYCTACDCPAGEGHVHVAEDHEAKLVAEQLVEIGERPEPKTEPKAEVPEVRHVSLIEWRKDAVLTMGEWNAAVAEWRRTQ
jgi:hypothetical protein